MSKPDRIEQLGTYEMVWDCKYCGTQSLPARTHKFCPNCGAAQDPKSRRFPSDDEKKAVENYVNHGADVICAACSTPNSAEAKFCQQCGASLEGAEKVKAVDSQVRAEREKFAAQAKRDVSGEEFQADLQKAGVVQTATAAKNAASSRTTLILIGVAALVVVAVLVAIFWRRTASTILVGHEWERSISVEQFSPVPGGTWCDSMPFGAYNISRDQRQRSSRQVPDGEDCQVRRVDNSDGTFSEQRECTTRYVEEPIYDDYCSFTTNQWVFVRAEKQTGSSVSDTPRWPQLSLNTGSCLGCEREGGRDETYTLVLQSSDDKTYRCNVDFDHWQQAQEQTDWSLQVSVVTGQPNCGSLKPATAQ